MWLLHYLNFKHFILWLPCLLFVAYSLCCPDSRWSYYLFFLPSFSLISSLLFPAGILWLIHHYNHCSIHLLIICLNHIKVLLKLSVYSPSTWPMRLNWLEKSTQSWFHFKIRIMDLSWALHAAQSLRVSCLCLCFVLHIHSGVCSGRWQFHTCFFSPDLQHLHFLALSCA